MSKSKSRKTFVILGSIICILIIVGCYTYHILFGENIFSKNDETNMTFTVATGSTSNDILKKIESEFSVNTDLGLQLVASILDLDNNIYPGMYELHNGMSSWEFVRLLRSGKRQTIKLTLNFERHYEDILRNQSQYIEADSTELLAFAKNQAFLDSTGFNQETLICLFLLDTYEFYWNTSAEQFFTRMIKEYNAFWNDERSKKANAIGLTPQEVMTLASIVDQETQINDEKPKIAGVYMNRLNSEVTGRKLQADPTIKYALNDFEIKRVREGHKKKAKNSPYNTYEHEGLPPGPICTPTKAGIDAVLNYEHHNYYYFCAQPNYSGYSDFSTTFNEHLKKARAYQKWLTKEGF